MASEKLAGYGNKNLIFSAPQLLKLDVTANDIERLKEKPTEIMGLGMYLGADCNLACKHCLSDADERQGEELTTAKRIALIDESYKLGSRQLIISGAGEPLLDPGFWDVIDHATDLDMFTIVYSNTTTIDEITAKRISEKPKLSINAKKYSFDKEISNTIFGGDYFDQVEKGLENLIKVGMNRTEPTRLGIQCTLLSLNLHEIPDMMRWCRKNNIVPQFNRLFIVGKATDPEIIKWGITDEQYKELSVELEKIDREEFGIQWPKYWDAKSPILAGNCVRPSYWVAIDECGRVKGCSVDPRLTIGDINGSTLTQFMLDNSDIIEHMRKTYGQNDCFMIREEV